MAPTQQQYGIIATPPPAQTQLITVSAILFAPEEGSSPCAYTSHGYGPLIQLCLYIIEKPRTITLNCQPPQTPSQGICPTPLVQDYFVGGQANSVVLTQGLNGEPLRFPLHLFYSPVSLSTGAPINRAIYRITSGAAPKAWCGAVVVLKFNGSRRQGYSDAGTNDLPALSAYFLAYK